MEYRQTGILLHPNKPNAWKYLALFWILGFFFFFWWKLLSYLFYSKFPQTTLFLHQPLQCINLNRGWMNRFTCNSRAPFLTQLQNIAIYFLQRCISGTVKQSWISHCSMRDLLMAMVKATQDEVEQYTRIFSSVNKMLKEKPLDPDPFLYAMSIWHTKKVFDFERWLSLKSITFESLWLNGGLS